MFTFLQVQTRYYGSAFMGHGQAETMVEHFDSCIEGLNKRKLLQISMDGPNVNHKFHRLYDDTATREYHHSLLNIGSCGLHVIHGAFKDGAEASEWPAQKLLLALYHLFKDSPARREDYTKISGSSVYPLKFCSHRWLENVPVAERALQVWPNVRKYVKEVQAKKFTVPKCASYDVVVESMKDPLIIVKLHSFISIAKMFSPFLAIYQTDRPMVPFIAHDLFTLCKNIMKRFIKDVEVAKLTNIAKLAKFDVDQKEHHKEHREIEIGFEAEQKLKSLPAPTSERQTMELRMQCKQFLHKATKKILNKSPIKYPLARYVSCIDPRLMASSREECENAMKKLLVVLTEAGWVASSSCDDILNQFGNFLDEVVASDSETFKSFIPSHTESRVDEFLHSFMTRDQKYQKLWMVVKQILILSHGQSTVERGFSINKQVVADNQQQQNLVAQRIVCDYINHVGGVLKVDIDQGLMASCTAARQRYQNYLDDERMKQERDRVGMKRKDILSEIDNLKKKRLHLEKDVNSLIKSADEFAEKAEQSRDFSCISKSNTLRKRAKEKEDELKNVKSTLDIKVQELKQ